jgi:hypothetical protein
MCPANTMSGFVEVEKTEGIVSDDLGPCCAAEINGTTALEGWTYLCCISLAPSTFWNLIEFYTSVSGRQKHTMYSWYRWENLCIVGVLDTQGIGVLAFVLFGV